MIFDCYPLSSNMQTPDLYAAVVWQTAEVVVTAFVGRISRCWPCSRSQPAEQMTGLCDKGVIHIRKLLRLRLLWYNSARVLIEVDQSPDLTRSKKKCPATGHLKRIIAWWRYQSLYYLPNCDTLVKKKKKVLYVSGYIFFSMLLFIKIWIQL